MRASGRRPSPPTRATETSHTEKYITPVKGVGPGPNRHRQPSYFFQVVSLQQTGATYSESKRKYCMRAGLWGCPFGGPQRPQSLCSYMTVRPEGLGPTGLGRRTPDTCGHRPKDRDAESCSSSHGHSHGTAWGSLLRVPKTAPPQPYTKCLLLAQAQPGSLKANLGKATDFLSHW